MQLISAQTLSSASASVTFSSIPQTFTDLKVLISARCDIAQTGISVTFNGSGTSYSTKRLWSDGSTTYSDGPTGSAMPMFGVNDSTFTAKTFSNAELYFPNYTSSNYKSGLLDGVTENNAQTVLNGLTAGLWSNTSAITSIILTGGSSSNFVAGSSFYLYGISSDTANQNTSGPYAFGGDTITTDGTYWYHTFLYSNSFIPQKNLTVDYLLVAGGGGGGYFYGGGGGAGGYRTFTSQSLTSGTVYPALVGAGGPGCTTNGDVSAFKGSNSSFNSTSATGGGAGNGIYGENGAAGGSGGGGGGAYNNETSCSIGVGGAGNQGGYSPVEGYAGACGGTNPATRLGGGGGGSSAVGSGNTGGAGTANSISGSSVTYAAGGSGNASRYAAPAAAGAAGTGNGGGGSGEGQGNGTAGGSGIIIVRYAV